MDSFYKTTIKITVQTETKSRKKGIKSKTIELKAKDYDKIKKIQEYGKKENMALLFMHTHKIGFPELEMLNVYHQHIQQCGKKICGQNALFHMIRESKSELKWCPTSQDTTSKMKGDSIIDVYNRLIHKQILTKENKFSEIKINLPDNINTSSFFLSIDRLLKFQSEEIPEELFDIMSLIQQSIP